MIRDTIFQQINDERRYQDTVWGTAFDDKNTLNDWLQYINQYGSKASKMGVRPEEQRAMLVKVAALAVAALETFDRNNGFAPRHYDGGSN